MQLQPAHSMTAEAGSCILGKRKSDVGDYVEPTDADSFQARKRGRLQDGPALGDERMQFGVLSEGMDAGPESVPTPPGHVPFVGQDSPVRSAWGAPATPTGWPQSWPQQDLCQQGAPQLAQSMVTVNSSDASEQTSGMAETCSAQASRQPGVASLQWPPRWPQQHGQQGGGLPLQAAPGMPRSSSAPDVRLLVNTNSLPGPRNLLQPSFGNPLAGALVPYKGPEQVILEAHNAMARQEIMSVLSRVKHCAAHTNPQPSSLNPAWTPIFSSSRVPSTLKRKAAEPLSHEHKFLRRDLHTSGIHSSDSPSFSDDEAEPMEF